MFWFFFFLFFPLVLNKDFGKKDIILWSLLISKFSLNSSLMTSTAEFSLGERDEILTCSRFSLLCWTTPWSWTFPRSVTDGLFFIFCLAGFTFLDGTHRKTEHLQHQLKVMEIALWIYHVCNNTITENIQVLPILNLAPKINGWSIFTIFMSEL